MSLLMLASKFIKSTVYAVYEQSMNSEWSQQCVTNKRGYQKEKLVSSFMST